MLSIVFLNKAQSQWSLCLEHNRFNYKNGTGGTLKYDYDLENDSNISNLSLQWNLSFGVADNDGYYVRFPAGIALAGLLEVIYHKSRDDSSDFKVSLFGYLVCALPALLPNRISASVWETQKSSLSIYAEPINLIWWSSNVEKKFSYAPQLGVMYKFGSINMETGAIYQPNVGKFGFQFGVSFDISEN